jgi:hypothetical protein
MTASIINLEEMRALRAAKKEPQDFCRECMRPKPKAPMDCMCNYEFTDEELKDLYSIFPESTSEQL